MAEVVEVVASLGDSVIAIAHGVRVTVGEEGEIYAPLPTRAFTLGDVDGAWSTSAGLLRIEVRRTSAVERVPRAATRGTVAAYLAASLVAHLVVLMTLPGPAHGDDGRRTRSGFVPLVASAGDHAGGDASDAATGRASATRAGSPSHPTMALADAPATLRGDLVGEIAGHAAVDTARDVPTARARSGPRDAREDATDRDARRAAAVASARTAGILGADSLRGAHAFGRIPGTGEPAIDPAGHGIDGAARGEDSASAFANRRRLAGDCTGDDCGTIGTGRYATLCGDTERHLPCARAGELGGTETRVAVVPSVTLCGSRDRRTPSPCVAVTGELDKTIIRRYLRRKLAALQGCYERALLSDAELAGTIALSFVIDATGRPRDVHASGVRADVDACVASVVESIRFPRSRNATQVTYPLSFHVAGT